MRWPITLAGWVSVAAPLTAQGFRSDLLSADAHLSDAVFRGGAAASIPAALGSDGVLVWPGAGMVSGVETATRFFSRQPLLQEARISWQPLRVDFSPDSSLALVVGVVVLDRGPTPGIFPIHRIGRYLAAWKQASGEWQLAALGLVNVLSAGETIWNEVIGPSGWPPLRSVGQSTAFIAADSISSTDAPILGISKTLEKWAAADAMTFAATGELNLGPKRIGDVLAANTANWQWTVVAAGSSTDGSLGWTAGEALVAPHGGGEAVKTKYLTFWRRSPDGSIRFIARGSNARP